VTEDLHCWHCGKSLVDVILPMSRREECSHCSADQHVCKMCVHFDAKFRGSCNEERAEAVSDAGKANFCDYFLPRSGSFTSPAQQKALDAKRQFAELFGDVVEGEPLEGDEEDMKQQQMSKAEIAKQKLRDLFGD
jgi:hypothetical protein